VRWLISSSRGIRIPGGARVDVNSCTHSCIADVLFPGSDKVTSGSVDALSLDIASAAVLLREEADGDGLGAVVTTSSSVS
jgi:hypothetical protein